MASINIPITLQGRPAVYIPNKYRAHKLGLPTDRPNLLRVNVLGLFQLADDDEVGAAFVVELADGRCFYAGIDEVTFVDKEDSHAEHCD